MARLTVGVTSFFRIMYRLVPVSLAPSVFASIFSTGASRRATPADPLTPTDLPLTLWQNPACFAFCVSQSIGSNCEAAHGSAMIVYRSTLCASTVPFVSVILPRIEWTITFLVRAWVAACAAIWPSISWMEASLNRHAEATIASMTPMEMHWKRNLRHLANRIIAVIRPIIERTPYWVCTR